MKSISTSLKQSHQISQYILDVEKKDIWDLDMAVHKNLGWLLKVLIYFSALESSKAIMSDIYTNSH